MNATQRHKFDHILLGEQIVCTDDDLDAFAEEDCSNLIRSIPNPQQTGTLDRWLASIYHGLRPGVRVECANGWFPDGTERPMRRGRVVDLYGPSCWPRVQFDDKPEGDLETHVPHAFAVID